jgi:hypothetical protein
MRPPSGRRMVGPSGCAFGRSAMSPRAAVPAGRRGHREVRPLASARTILMEAASASDHKRAARLCLSQGQRQLVQGMSRMPKGAGRRTPAALPADGGRRRETGKQCGSFCGYWAPGCSAWR